MVPHFCDSLPEYKLASFVSDENIVSYLFLNDFQCILVLLLNILSILQALLPTTANPSCTEAVGSCSAAQHTHLQ